MVGLSNSTLQLTKHYLKYIMVNSHYLSMSISNMFFFI